VLLFAALERLTGAAAPSGLAAALFAVHPLHVESVAWVAERKDVLSTTLWLLTMCAWAGYARAPGAARYALVCLLLALGLAAKPMLVTLPLVLLLLDVWPLGRVGSVGWRRAVLEKLPLLGLALVSAVVTLAVQRAGGAVRTLDHLPLGARLANALWSYLAYLGHTVWPSGLAVFYPHPGAAISWLKPVLSSVALAAITAAVLRRRRERPYLLAGWLWYLGTLVPVIGLVQVGEQAMADRYTYVPLIGIFVALSWLGWEALGRRDGRLAAAALPVLLLLGIVAHAQVRVWQDSVTLFRHALAVTENNHTAHLNLGMALAERGDLEEAVRQYRETLRIRPDYAHAHNNLGVALSRLGDERGAIEQYREALRLDPANAEAHYNLGQSLVAAGRTGPALERFREAVRLDPDYVEARYNLGTLLARQGAWPEAVDQLRRVIELRPGYAEAHYNLGLALRFLGDAEGSRREIEAARRLGFEVPAETR